MISLAFAMFLFVGTHFLMSHLLRAAMVARLGEPGFLAVYSLVSLGLLIWAVMLWHSAPVVPLWFQYFEVVIAGHVVMLIACILLAGSLLTRNPALVGAGGLLKSIDGPRGIMRVTRHPMMWAFALWAAAHIAITGQLSTLIFAGGISVLALVGAKAQDVKKRSLMGDDWTAWERETSFAPSPAWPGVLPILAGLALYAFLVWLHPAAFGSSTLLWEFIL